MSRWIRFFIAILVGIALGLLWGWVIKPVEYINTSPDTLRIDYKTDYVLMVAEAFQADADLGLAVRRLALLGSPTPDEMIHQAILSAEGRYTDIDLSRMRSLEAALQAYSALKETPLP
jgi:hypothetical protein